MDYQLPDEPWAQRVLLRTEVGSTAWGTGLPGKEDHDEIAVVWEPIQSLAGLHHHPETIRHRPGRGEGDRSQPGDFDLVVYTARKFARLLVKGNPSIIAVLFGPEVGEQDPVGSVLRGWASVFATEQCLGAYIGYQTAQYRRFLGVQGGKHTNRPELIEEFGFDTKYAMHMVRLGYQGIEYLSTGRIAAPIEPEIRQRLLGIRSGKYTMGEVCEMGDEVQSRLRTVKTDHLVPIAEAERRADQWLALTYNSSVRGDWSYEWPS